LQEVIAKVGKERMKILCMGTQADLDLLSPHLSSYSARYVQHKIPCQMGPKEFCKNLRRKGHMSLSSKDAREWFWDESDLRKRKEVTLLEPCLLT
jgi:hypothetical protein